MIECNVNEFSSRVCEFGTMGCDVEHRTIYDREQCLRMMRVEADVRDFLLSHGAIDVVEALRRIILHDAIGVGQEQQLYVADAARCLADARESLADAAAGLVRRIS